MVEDSSGAVDVDKLRKRLEEISLEKLRLQAQLEQAADKQFAIIKVSDENDKPLGNMLFRRWNHEEVSKLYSLPFFKRINEKLEDDEQKLFEAIQYDMVLDAISDRGKWEPFLNKNPEFVKLVFDRMCFASGLNKEFADGLDEFMNSEQGWSYGFVWFVMLKKTPSEIAKLPETDVVSINSWISKWSERIRNVG